MGAEVEFLGNWLRVRIIFGGVESHEGVEKKIGLRQWNLKVVFKVVAEVVIFIC